MANVDDNIELDEPIPPYTKPLVRILGDGTQKTTYVYDNSKRRRKRTRENIDDVLASTSNVQNTSNSTDENPIISATITPNNNNDEPAARNEEQSNTPPETTQLDFDQDDGNDFFPMTYTEEEAIEILKETENFANETLPNDIDQQIHEIIEKHSKNNETSETSPEQPSNEKFEGIQFIKDLKDSLKSTYTENNTLELEDLRQLSDRGKSFEKIATALLVLYCNANIPKLHMNKVVCLVKWMLKATLSPFFFKTTNTLFSKFINLFSNSSSQKMKSACGKGEMIFFDLEKAFQAKFNTQQYRKSLYDGKKRILKRILEKSYLKEYVDINDGTEMRKWNDKYFLKGTTFSKQGFIDGISPFKSGNESLTPVFLVDLQLSIDERFKMQNMVLAALLSTKRAKFDYEYYMKQFVANITKQLSSFSIILNKKSYKCEAQIVDLVMDISEKEKSLMISSGYFACELCDTRGEIPTGLKKVYYPNKGVDRTPNSCLVDRIVAEKVLKCKKKKSFRGIKGNTVLAQIPGLKIPYSITGDEMHTFDLGTLLLMLEYWTGKHKSFTKFKLSKHQIETIDEILEEICVCDSYSRRPGSLLHVGKWKADEVKNFFLYFFVVLEDSLPPAYFDHTVLFIRFYRIVQAPSITIAQFQHAQMLLSQFKEKIVTLYGVTFFTKKTHQIIFHFMDHIRRWGPLAHFSSKRYEDLNGEMMRKNYGKFKIGDQLIEKVNLASTEIAIVNNIEKLEDDEKFYDLIQHLGYKPFQKQKSGWEKLGEIEFKNANDEQLKEFSQTPEKHFNTQQQQFLSQNAKKYIVKLRIGKRCFKVFETGKRNSTYCLIRI